MAQILPFSSAERRSRPERSGMMNAAEIVIFPGVRVEYHDEPPKPAGSGRPRGGGRGRRTGAAFSA